MGLGIPPLKIEILLESNPLKFLIIPKFPRRDSKPKKRLREHRAIIHIKDNNTNGIALFSRSLFLGLESLLGNSWICLISISASFYFATCTSEKSIFLVRRLAAAPLPDAAAKAPEVQLELPADLPDVLDSLSYMARYYIIVYHSIA